MVATPLGNLRDITLRALDILRSVDLIASEDTRTTLKLLNHFDLKGPRLISFHEHNQKKRTEELLRALKEGQKVALVSEAGTPGISDPGAYLVRRAHEEGLAVRPVPGPSALCCALSVSGFPLKEGFVFLGFLPAKKTRRERLLYALRDEPRPLLFFEAPHRLEESLESLLEILGDREVFLAREMTKLHEEYLLTTLSALKARFSQEPPRGEFTLLVAGASKDRASQAELERALKEALAQGVSVKEAASLVAKRFSCGRKKLYELALKIKETL